MTFSTNDGQTWSQPISVDTHNGFHVFPTIANDASTGTVSVVDYITEGDYFEHEIRLILNQIPPGSTALGPPEPVTSSTPSDDPPASVSRSLLVSIYIWGQPHTAPGRRESAICTFR
jgi:hypothetical protein